MAAWISNTTPALAGLSPTFRRVAARLLAATPSDRQPIWDEFLAGKLNTDPMRGSDRNTRATGAGRRGHCAARLAAIAPDT